MDQVRRMGGEIDKQNGKQIRVRFKNPTPDDLMPDFAKCLIVLCRPV